MEKISKENFKAKIANGAALVCMGAPWCPDCRKAEPMLALLEKEFSAISFFKLDFDEDLELKDELKVQRIPTIIFFKDGKEVGSRVVEPDSKDKIAAAIKAAF